MPTIDATNVASVINGGPVGLGATFSSRRDATSGTTIDASSDGTDMGYYNFGGRGPTIVVFTRVFARFPTASIEVTPSAATLKIYGRANFSTYSNPDFLVVAGTQGTGDPSTADFDAIAGWDVSGSPSDGSNGGDQEGNVTAYAAEWVQSSTAWDESDYNEITLNAAALSAMASLDNFYICIIEATHDLNDKNRASTRLVNGMYFDDDAGKEMQIDYTAGVAAAADNAVFFGTNF